MDGNALAARAARLLDEAFDSYHESFREITRRAARRFEECDWRGARNDAAARLALYKERVDSAVAELRAMLGASASDVALWTGIKEAFVPRLGGRTDAELAATFYNSVTRRVIATVGVNPAVEFVGGLRPIAAAQTPSPPGMIRSVRLDRVTSEAVRRLLAAFHWHTGYAHLDRDASLAADALDVEVRRLFGAPGPVDIDLLTSAFYRNKGAYIVGRVRRADGGGGTIPLVLPLLSGGDGIRLDAVLLTSDEASVVFGFSWSYFHVEVPNPAAMVRFLASIMPNKRVDELYTAIGYNKHGKTELYRTLVEHMEAPDARFELAEGEAGLVMTVFTLPSFNVVFKVIKDSFGQPKRTTRRAVMDKYHFVFIRDRVGRLADAQEFEHLAFRASCFSRELLDELLRDAGSTVRVEGDRVVFAHLYTERRVIPLNIFLREAPPDAARDAVIDYGTAIKDLARANIFTGDMLLKNFGVTRHGRVICYDYDELCLLTDCHFRRIPQPASADEEMAAEPWFYVGENDVFPEEFRAFLVPPGELRDAFLRSHADLLDVDFWLREQATQRAGEMADVFPYPQSRRIGGE